MGPQLPYWITCTAYARCTCVLHQTEVSPVPRVLAIADLILFGVYFQSGSKSKAEKIIKNIMKIFIKVSILYRNSQFSEEELTLAESFRRKFLVSYLVPVINYQ